MGHLLPLIQQSAFVAQVGQGQAGDSLIAQFQELLVAELARAGDAGGFGQRLEAVKTLAGLTPKA